MTNPAPNGAPAMIGTTQWILGESVAANQASPTTIDIPPAITAGRRHYGGANPSVAR